MLRNSLLLSGTLFLSACSTMQQDKQDVYAAHSADLASTALALASGAAEANPLGIFVVPAKIGMTEYCDKQSEPDRTICLHTVEAVSWGATANNLTWFVAPPAAPFVGVAVGSYKWKQGESRRNYMIEMSGACAMHRVIESNPELVCKYNPETKTQ